MRRRGMEILIAVLCFLNGLALGAGGVLVLKREKAQKGGELCEMPAAGSMAAQVENFLNYDGTSRGQRWLDER